MKIKYLGHSSFHIELGGVQFVIDPFITGNPKASSLSIDDINSDYVLLTHGHQDHTLDAETIARSNKAPLISNYEISTVYEALGLSTIGMNVGGVLDLQGVSVRMVQAVHSSSQSDGKYAGDPSGFVIYDEYHCIYISGDTALTMDMKLIPMLCPPLSAAILCIGDHLTMGYKDAAIAADFIECNKIIGCHYDSYPPIEIDHEAAKQHFSGKGKELTLLNIGQSLQF